MRRATARSEDVSGSAAGCPPREADVEDLYRRHRTWLAQGLRRRFGRQSESAVEDVVQETYVRAARRTDSGRLQEPRAFLATIAFRLMLDELRRRRRGEALVNDPAAPDALVQAPEQETAVLIKQAVMSLPPPLREVLLLNRVAGLGYAAIAERCGVSVKTVEWRMTQALKHCRALVGPPPDKEV